MKAHLTHPVFKIIAEIIKQQSVHAFVIGGFVRDVLLKRPNKDIDIVVLGDGIAIANLVAAKIGPDINVAVFKILVLPCCVMKIMK